MTIAEISAGTGAFLLTYLLHSTVFLLLALGLLRLARRATPARAEGLLKLALVGGLLTAACQASLGIAPLGGSLPWADPSVSTGPVAGSFDHPAAARSLQVAESLHPVAPTLQGRRTATLEGTLAGPVISSPSNVAAAPQASEMLGLKLVAGLLGTSTLIGMLLLAVRWVRLRRRLAGRQVLSTGPAFQALKRLRQRAGFSREVRLSVSDRIASPIAMGIWRQEICLPPRALAELEEQQLSGVLAHELAHLVWNDPLWLLLQSTMRTLFFFQPLNRMASLQLREMAELRADAWAVAHTGSAPTLALSLTTIADWVLEGEPLQQGVVASTVEKGSPLSRRVEVLLSGSAPSPRCPSLLRSLILAVGALALAVWLTPRITVGTAAALAKPATADEIKAGLRAEFYGASALGKNEGELRKERPAAPENRGTGRATGVSRRDGQPRSAPRASRGREPRSAPRASRGREPRSAPRASHGREPRSAPRASHGREPRGLSSRTPAASLFGPTPPTRPSRGRQARGITPRAPAAGLSGSTPPTRPSRAPQPSRAPAALSFGATDHAQPTAPQVMHPPHGLARSGTTAPNSSWPGRTRGVGRGSSHDRRLDFTKVLEETLQRQKKRTELSALTENLALVGEVDGDFVLLKELGDQLRLFVRHGGDVQLDSQTPSGYRLGQDGVLQLEVLQDGRHMRLEAASGQPRLFLVDGETNQLSPLVDGWSEAAVAAVAEYLAATRKRADLLALEGELEGVERSLGVIEAQAERAPGRFSTTSPGQLRRLEAERRAIEQELALVDAKNSAEDHQRRLRELAQHLRSAGSRLIEY